MIAMDGRSIIASKRKLHGIESFAADNRTNRNAAVNFNNSRDRSLDRVGYGLAAAGLSQIEQGRLKQIEPSYFTQKRNSQASFPSVSKQTTPLK